MTLLPYWEGDSGIPGLMSHSSKFVQKRTSAHGERQLTMPISGSSRFDVTCRRARLKGSATRPIGERSKEEADELEHDASTEDEQK